MPPAAAYCSWMRRVANAGSPSRSAASRSENSRRPSILAKVAITGLPTAGSAMRISSKATSAATTSRVLRAGSAQGEAGSSW